jgi:hypothetical protein
MVKRFTTTPHTDFSITSKVRTVLMEGGHYDLVAEQLVDALRDIERMARSGLDEHGKRIKMLEDAERQRLTDTGVMRLIDAKLTSKVAGWMKWAIRGLIGAIGTALLAGFYEICKLAWLGAHH